jgi:hypothetical protein
MTIGLLPDAKEPGFHCDRALDPGLHGVPVVRRMLSLG